MPAQTELGLFARALPIQHALEIGRARVRVVAAWFAPEVEGRIAGIFIPGRWHCGSVGAIPAHEALEAGPRFDQRAVDREGLVTDPAFLARQLIELGKEQLGHVGREHPLVVLGKDAVIGTALATFAVQKPEPEQIVAKLYAEEPLGAHAVEGGVQASLEQLLGRNTGPPQLFEKVLEQGRESFADLTDLALDAPQGMRSAGTHALRFRTVRKSG